MNKAKLYELAMLTAGTTIAEAQNTPVSQMEKLTRGVVVVPAASGSGQFISWRLLGTDNDATTFDILKDGKLLKTDIFDKTEWPQTLPPPLHHGATYTCSCHWTDRKAGLPLPKRHIPIALTTVAPVMSMATASMK